MSAHPHQQRPSRLARLADLAFRRRRTVLLAWIVALAAAFAASARWPATSPPTTRRPARSPSAAGDLLTERFPGAVPDTVDVVWQAPQGVDSAAVRERTDTLLAAATRLEGIGRRRAAPRSRATARSRSRACR